MTRSDATSDSCNAFVGLDVSGMARLVTPIELVVNWRLSRCDSREMITTRQ